MKTIDSVVDNSVGIFKGTFGLAKSIVNIPIELGEKLYEAVHSTEEKNVVVRSVDTGLNTTAETVNSAKQLVQDAIDKITSIGKAEKQ